MLDLIAKSAKAIIAAVVPALLAVVFTFVEGQGIVLSLEAKATIISTVTGALVWLIPNRQDPVVPTATK